LAEAYRKAGDREIETILAATAGTPLFHQIYGDIYKDHHSWGRATAHYNEALKIDPHWKGAHIGIAEADAAQGKLAEASAELRKELDIDPASAAARARLAALSGGSDGALEQSAGEDPAQAGETPGALADAETKLRRKIEQRPADLQARYALARVFKGESLALTNMLIRQDPDSPRVHQMLGQTYEDRQQERQALAEYKIVEQKDPSLPGIHYEIGHLLWGFGDHEGALAELHQELKQNPDNAEANGEIGSILLVDGEPAKAIPYLEAALRSDPSLALIHRQLGKAYLTQKNLPRAEAELKQAIKTDTDGSALYQLGMVYRAQGRTEEAAKVIAASQKIRAAHLDAPEDTARDGMAQ
jgi:tetratricopeptide (TPR) repeat protein